MPARVSNPRPRGRHYIKEWREFRGLTQDGLAERMGTSKATISRIESFVQPYTQDVLEFCAYVLSTTPMTLISRPPTADDAPTPPDKAPPGHGPRKSAKRRTAP